MISEIVLNYSHAVEYMNVFGTLVIYLYEKYVLITYSTKKILEHVNCYF